MGSLLLSSEWSFFFFYQIYYLSLQFIENILFSVLDFAPWFASYFLHALCEPMFCVLLCLYRFVLAYMRFWVLWNFFSAFYDGIRIYFSVIKLKVEN